MSPEACQRISELRSGHAPAAMPQSSWESMVRDARAFIDTEKCAQAASLGWDDLDLLGVDDRAPYARIDQLGLLWLLRGGKSSSSPRPWRGSKAAMAPNIPIPVVPAGSVVYCLGR